MREIKFRAWDKDSNKMIFQHDTNGVLETNDYYFSLNEDDVVLLYYDEDYCDYLVCNAKLMQYTGLIDKNGKEIYEGDILSYKHITYTDCSKIEIEEIEDESFIEMITYTPIASIVKPHSKNVKCFGYDSINKECLILDLTNNEVEVIGNKFENPELLG